jgi:hypothetical protein
MGQTCILADFEIIYAPRGFADMNDLRTSMATSRHDATPPNRPVQPSTSLGHSVGAINHGQHADK